MFVKVFETEKYGQVLVFIDLTGEGDAKLRIIGYTPKGFQAACGFGYDGDDGGWGRAQETLQNIITQDRVEAVMADLFKMLDE